jgi:CDP-glucose 4,6-dehydratase
MMKSKNSRYFDGLYRDKTVLVTGHTGFKGSWLTLWLHSLGANVIGLSVDIPTQPSHFECASLGSCVDDRRLDIRDATAVRELLTEVSPDFVFHLAAQPLVRRSYAEPLATFETNVLGTANILSALVALTKRCTAVLITSDKCYDNVEWVWGYRETDRLGGKDPYSASKGAAELVIRSFVKSFFLTPEASVRVAVGRAGNVIGGGDWAADRVVPDCVRAWSVGEKVPIRNPSSTRPWQHVLEPLSGYLALGERLYTDASLHGEPFNFGPTDVNAHTVVDLIQTMNRYLENAHWTNESIHAGDLHEAGLLKLNCDKAHALLTWRPVLTFRETVQMTAEWYRDYYQQPTRNMATTSLQQISIYSQLAAQRRLDWATGDTQISSDTTA